MIEMLTYKFLYKTENKFVFAYFPNGNEDAPGKIAITSNGDGRVLEESKDDFGKRYAYHAIKGIDTNQKTGTVAWY